VQALPGVRPPPNSRTPGVESAAGNESSVKYPEAIDWQ
jgi:hypothetical protein